MREENLPFINNSLLLDPKNEFVAWVDIMGISMWSARSYKATITFILRLHSKMLQIIQSFPKTKKTLFYYPLIDGFFLTSEDDKTIHEALKQLFEACAKEFLRQRSTVNSDYVFMPRGAIAYGEVMHGNDIPDFVFSENEIKKICFLEKLLRRQITRKKNLVHSVYLCMIHIQRI